MLLINVSSQFFLIVFLMDVVLHSFSITVNGIICPKRHEYQIMLLFTLCTVTRLWQRPKPQYSHLSQHIFYDSDNTILFQNVFPGKTILTSKKFLFRFSARSGTYQVCCYQQIDGSQYAALFADTLEVYNYVVRNLTYDYDLADNVEAGYLPDVDATLKSKKGICFDYAALTTAMLRARDIPCKLQIGYAGTVKHAWITVYIRSKGWVDKGVEFSGDSWSRMDPTFDSNSQDEETIQQYIGDDDNYSVQFTR